MSNSYKLFILSVAILNIMKNKNNGEFTKSFDCSHNSAVSEVERIDVKAWFFKCNTHFIVPFY